VLRPKIIYFLYFAALGALSPFLLLYYQELGLSAGQIGVLTGFFPIMMLFGAPFWGNLADTTGRHKTITLLIMVAALVSGVLLFYLKTYPALLLGVGIFSFCLAPIIPLNDSNVLAMLAERKHEYGRQRVWGAVGWGLVAPFVGLLVERYGLAAAFFSYALLMFACTVAVAGLPLSKADSSPEARTFKPFLRSDWLVLLSVLFILGIGLGVCNNFVFLYLAELDANNLLVGLSLTTATISEVPFTFFGGWLLQRFKPFALIYVSLLALILRLFLYSLAHEPVPVILVQLLHGLTFSVAWIAAVNYANRIAPAGLGATAQGLISGTLMGLGSAAGGLLGGVLYERFSAIIMFRMIAAVLIVGFLLLLLSRTKYNQAKNLG
jgi:PPP family 3-phenylpropionic acid transporter